jgi:uncharacterized membrane protein YhaH (DUF805 family)
MNYIKQNISNVLFRNYRKNYKIISTHFSTYFIICLYIYYIFIFIILCSMNVKRLHCINSDRHDNMTI